MISSFVLAELTFVLCTILLKRVYLRMLSVRKGSFQVEAHDSRKICTKGRPCTDRIGRYKNGCVSPRYLVEHVKFTRLTGCFHDGFCEGYQLCKIYTSVRERVNTICQARVE